MYAGVHRWLVGAAKRAKYRSSLARGPSANPDKANPPRFKIAIVGSGPAGLAAAVQAARRGLSYILLERGPRPDTTVFSYQKRKPVMALPEALPLRSSNLPFEEGPRESVIEAFDAGARRANLNIRLNAEVTEVRGQHGNFQLSLANGGNVSAEVVVLAVGVQGDHKKLSVPGADLPFVQYRLDDPDEYRDEEFVIIGVGDAGIETALSLAPHNSVTVVNRGAHFPRAKRSNARLIEAAIGQGRIRHVTHSRVRRIEPGRLVLATKQGEVRIKCDRIIARLGALPPRAFLETCGIGFTSTRATALPRLSTTYEANVKGLYIIGALTGHPLLKQCLNQGFEVIENILGNEIEPIIASDISVSDQNPKMPVTGVELRNATSSFIIDLNRCIDCGNCEAACAETHDGIGNLDIHGGPTFGHLHFADSCLHCVEAPCLAVACLAPDVIRRGDHGEIYIAENCIGCGNCAKACPFGLITMARLPPEKPRLLSWLLFGRGPGPGEDEAAERSGGYRATKCDLCRDVKEGPACVRACPVGAAIREQPTRSS